jgi:hypothetical protein
MAEDLKPNQRRHIREKSVIDHLTRKLYEPKPAAENKEDTNLHPCPVKAGRVDVFLICSC